VTINERVAAGRRERRVLARVSRAAWRLEQAERERTWALVSARAERISIRTLATAAGQQAGPPPKIRTPGRTPNSAAGTASPTGYRMR